MDPPSPALPDRGLRVSIAVAIVILVILAFVPIALSGTSGYAPVNPGTAVPAIRTDTEFAPFTPLFTDPSDKLKETSSPDFTRMLYHEAETYEPLLHTPGTQVNMGFWSGRGNHGSLVVLMDAINDLPPSPSQPPQRAIWDEGATSSNQYPSYVTMLNEHWYDRAMAKNGTVIVLGTSYTDPHPVTFVQADDIWGQYSQRYADMAVPILQATGKPVNVWCFVEGARAGRIFYTYELPELRTLEQEGAVTVHFARTRTANWTEPGDWIVGTANAPVPAG